MAAGQIVFGVLLVVILLGMAGFVGWRQVQKLRHLRGPNDLAPADRTYLHRQAWRRLLCSGLMVVLAGLLAAHFRLEGPANELVAQGKANQQRGEVRPLDPAQAEFFKVYETYWAVTLLVLLGIIILAALDVFAIRRYGRQQYAQIRAERRAMIEDQLARLRSQRNGHD